MISTKIIHKTERTLLAEIQPQGKLVIYSDPLKNELMVSGIPVPQYLQEHYEGKRTIEWDDPNFKKAFIEIYVPNQLRESGYVVITPNKE